MLTMPLGTMAGCSWLSSTPLRSSPRLTFFLTNAGGTRPLSLFSDFPGTLLADSEEVEEESSGGKAIETRFC